MILRADARALPLKDESVDSIVTDPPYELGFMGKAWDKSGVAYDVDVWRGVFRVLKPGGHLLAFGGSRTYHRLACAIEDAGFEIRDQIQWIYGSGFPKSLDVSKAIDKAAGIWRGRAGAVASENAAMSGGNYERTAKGSGETAAAAWDGWGTALKPAHEPIVVARKPLIGTVAENVLTHGTGAINVGGCRIGTTVESWPVSRSYAPGQIQPGGKGETQATGDVPNGRWPANVIHDGSEEVVGLFPNVGISSGGTNKAGKFTNLYGVYKGNNPGASAGGFGDSGSAARFFYCAKASRSERNAGLEGFEEKPLLWSSGTKSPGTFQAEGTKRAATNNHPTVKPIDLMRYLCRLVTPPGGIVLDPFAGSGSTCRAAFVEGFKFIGIEIEEEYCRIASGRLNLLTAGLPI